MTQLLCMLYMQTDAFVSILFWGLLANVLVLLSDNLIG